MGKVPEKEKIARGRAGELRVVSELCRRGYFATATMGNTPDTDVVCVNASCQKTVFIQVKTFRVNAKTCLVGKKAEHDFGEHFFWVLVGLKDEKNQGEELFYIIPSHEMAEGITSLRSKWLQTIGRNGLKHNKKNSIRNVRFSAVNNRANFDFDVSQYKDRWDLITERLKA